MEQQLKIIKTTIDIGLGHEYKFLHITDTHIALDDDDLPPSNRYQCFDKDFENCSVEYYHMAAAYAKAPLVERLTALRSLLPYFDSWAMTDSVFPTLRFLESEKPLLWAFAMECIAGPGEYIVRSGIVILLRFFIAEAEPVAALLRGIRDERYYVQMAVAWCFAEMAVDHYEIVEKVLESGELHPFIHNKTIQKMRESYRISEEKKEAAQRLRRK